MIPKLQKLQTFSTSEGEMVPIYKDWEEWHEGYVPKMAYLTSIAPNTAKGPILHEKRRGFMMAPRRGRSRMFGRKQDTKIQFEK